VHLLLVEDDVRLGRALARLLRDDRHVVDVAERGETALELVEGANGIDAVILDVGLPDISGFDVARRIRAAGSGLAIIMLTARDAVDDRVKGLDAGADDYLVKPFAYDELAARIRALGRRSSPNRGARRNERRIVSGGIALDEASRRVYLAGAEIELSRQEFALLECLLRNPGRVLSRDELLDRAWPVGAALTPNAVEVYIHYLRTKLGPDGSRIQTVRGVGYRLADP